MFACKCLNISINIKDDQINRFDADQMKLTDEEKSDQFFNKEPGVVVAESIQKQQPGLVVSRTIGRWIIQTCLNCSLDTHAVHRDKGANCVLIIPNLMNGASNISTLRNSDSFSPAFGIVVGGGAPVGDVDTELTGWLTTASVNDLNGAAQTAASTLHRTLQEALRKELAVTEERVRRYTDQQYAALEAFRERAHRDHQFLLRLIAQQTKINSNETVLKPTPVIPTPVVKTPAPTILKPISNDELEITDNILFPMDGVEPQNHSDEESDTDDSLSHDEGIHIPRQRIGTDVFNMAKSLPVDIPIFHADHMRRPEHIEDKDDSIDIAASIRALAKSVHGDDIFGDLPRPRFSTQI